MQIQFPQNFKSLVVGSGGALGNAFVDYLKTETSCGHVARLSRSDGSGFDLENPESIESVVQGLREQGPFHLVVDATGALTIDDVGPEKSLSRLDAVALQRSFSINAIGPILLLRHLATLIASGDTIYAKLSARVGSISDNQKGGWYGYRASKAALNMFLQTAAIELQRKNPSLRIVALQPGTVRSRLSEPFQANVTRLLEPSESVAGMMQSMMSLRPKVGAYFIDYQGQEILW